MPATFDPSVAESITGAVPEHVQALAGTGGIPATYIQLAQWVWTHSQKQGLMQIFWLRAQEGLIL